MAKFWVTIALAMHGDHPPTFQGRIPELRAHFAETPGLPVAGGKSAEYDGGPILQKSQIIVFAITEEEYRAPNYELYIWANPYASLAFQEHGSHGGLAVGRLILTRRSEKRRGAVTVPVRGAGPGDLQIYYEVTLVNSVVQYIADEMNTNAATPEVTQIRLKMAQVAADMAAYQKLTGTTTEPRFFHPRSRAMWRSMTPEGRIWKRIEDTENQAEYDYGHLVHKDEGFSGFAQDIYFWGGGQWDHKPRIRPVWGTDQRLGNTKTTYFYDIWSNIHFGYVGRAAGIPLTTLTEGAGKAQFWDSGSTTGDDLIDEQGVIAGYNLYTTGGTVTVDDLLAILRKHPGWENSQRYPNR